MDVVALYPSITRAMAMEAIQNAIHKSDVKWENLDTKNLCRHVAMLCDRNKIERVRLGEVVPIPKSRTTFQSFTNPRDNARATGGDFQFGEVVREPSAREIKKLVGLMAASSVEICMSNHFYTIGGVIRKQKEGGSIGSDLTVKKQGST